MKARKAARRFEPRCGQCGRLFKSRACGMTHALMDAWRGVSKGRRPLPRKPRKKVK